MVLDRNRFCLLKKEEEEVVYIYNEMLLGHKKEWNFAICSNMVDLEGIMLHEISQRETDLMLSLICGI